MARINLSSWFSKEDWRERIITFDPSWFTACMATGIIIQLLTNFPYPAGWLRSLAYCFWILTIVIFAIFVVIGFLRLIFFPKLAVHVLEEFGQISYLGAIPISLDTIIVGITIFYPSGRYAAEALFWISVCLTTAVSCGVIFMMYSKQEEHKLSEVNGSWLLTFIPMIVTSATGAAVAAELAGQNSIAVLFVSFLMWSLGIGMSYMVLAIYLWRLMSFQLPSRDAIVSTFVPVGPLGMGAYAIQGLAVGLATHIRQGAFLLQRSPVPPNNDAVIGAITETIHWMGIIIAIALLGLATFFLIEAFFSVGSKVPKSFSVGFWSFVFPCGVYANAFCSMSTDLRNNGMKGWAATCVVFTILLWLGCALTTFWKGVMQGKLFFAPGLHGWLEKEAIDPSKGEKSSTSEDSHSQKDEFSLATGSNTQADTNGMIQRQSDQDGSYIMSRSSSATQAV